MPEAYIIANDVCLIKAQNSHTVKLRHVRPVSCLAEGALPLAKIKNRCKILFMSNLSLSFKQKA